MKRIISILAAIACFAFVVGCSKNGPYENFPKADSLYQTIWERLTLPEGLVSISENVFENCTALREINLPESLMLISEYAFCSCEALETLVLPDEITSIGDGAFDGCENLVLLVKTESVGEEYAIENDFLYEVK